MRQVGDHIGLFEWPNWGFGRFMGKRLDNCLPNAGYGVRMGALPVLHAGAYAVLIQ